MALRDPADIGRIGVIGHDRELLHQQHVITYLKEENRLLKSKLPGGRLRLTDPERRRLAKLAHPLSRKQLRDTATIVTPDTLMRWYNPLIADKFNSSKNRNAPGRPRVDEEIEQLVARMAEAHPTWGYRRIQGALANLGHTITRSPCAISNTCVITG